MSDNIIEITENTNYSITIDTSLVQNDNNIVIETSNPNSIDVINNTTVLVSDLPQGYPLDWTIGNLPISRVSGLDIVSGSGIGVTNNSGIYTVAVTGNFGLTSEEVDDRVSQLLIGGNNISLSYDDNSNTLSISASGLQPSGNYSFVGHGHVIADVSGLQLSLDNKQPSGVYASGIHYHISSDITNFNSSVDSRIVSANLQPSGNYSLVDHTHSSLNITDFNMSVSGLLPVKNIGAGSGISVTNNSGDFTVSVTGQFGLTSEQVDDRISNLLIAGSYVNLNYNDSLDSLTINVSGLQPSGNYSIVGHSHIIGDVSGLQVALDNKQPSGIYASGVHSHISNDITDFNNSVDSRIVLANLQPSGNYSLIGHNHNINDISGLQIVLDSKQPSGVYASGVHAHNASDITNFSSAVSGLLPTISGSGYVTSNFSNNSYIIGVSGLQPSGNYSIIGHAHTSSEITDFNNSVNGLVSGVYAPLISPNFSGTPTVPTATSGTNTNQIASTSFVRNEISNLVNSAPSTLDTLNELATALGNDSNFATTVASGLANKAPLVHSHIIADVSGLQTVLDNKQPSGVYASGIHIHNSNDITDFSSSVSGLLPVKNISAGSGIGISSVSGDFTVSVTGSFGLTNEEVDDRVSSLLFAGTGISLDYNDNSNILTINTSGLQPSGNYALAGHTHSSNDVIDFNTSVSGLLPSISGSGYAVISFNDNIYTVSVSGVQPSGNYANSVHASSHLPSGVDQLFDQSLNTIDIPTFQGVVADSNAVDSWLIAVNNYEVVAYFGVRGGEDYATIQGVLGARIEDQYSSLGEIACAQARFADDSVQTTAWTGTIATSGITDFNSSVSGLLPVKDIISGSGISVGAVSGIYTITADGVAAASASSLVTNCSNRTGSVIPKMTVVYINGGHGNLPTITPAQANNEANSSKTYGITQTQILDNGTGNVVVFGALIDVDTNQFGASEGSTLYLSPTVAGGITATKPSAPDHMVSVGKIIRNHNNQGIIEVVIQNGFELQELHNVAISGVNNGEFLQYNSASGLWVPSNSGNFTSLSVNSTGVSLSGHSHTVSNITDFNSGVSGLLPVVSGSGQASSSFVNNVYTISVTGLQPSGNYSTVGHTHTSSNITDFNSSVSGLLPVTNILGGANVSVSQSGTNFTVSVTGSLGLTTEEVDDRVSNLLVAGTGISLDYNDSFNTLTINTSGLQPSGNYSVVGHGHTTNDIADFNSSVSGLLPVKDILGSVYINVGSSSGTYTISVSGLQPSGNYANAIHYHTSADITDFNSSVSGLLPTIANSGDNRVLTSTGTSTGINAENNLTFDGSLLNVNGSGNFNNIFISGVSISEVIDDEVASLLVAGSGISLNYNDNANTLTISTINNIILSDVVDSTNYIGRAVAGTSTSSSSWRIKRTIYNSAGSVTSSTVANNVAWNDRLTASYS